MKLTGKAIQSDVIVSDQSDSTARLSPQRPIKLIRKANLSRYSVHVFHLIFVFMFYYTGN